MTKYTFVVFHKEVDRFLEDLQSLGVVDITRQHRAIDAHSKACFEEIARYQAVLKALRAVKEEVQKTNGNTSAVGEGNMLETAEEGLSLRQELKLAIAEAVRELDDSRPWGEFTGDETDKFRQLHLIPHFYVSSRKRFDPGWKKEYALHILNEENDKIYFVILAPEGEEFRFDLPEAKFPERSARAIEDSIRELEEKSGANDQKLLILAENSSKLQERMDELSSELDLYMARNGSRMQAEDTIAIFEGFAPAEIDSQVNEFLEKNNVYYFSEKAKTEDNPPIQLKNNFFTKLYEPIGELYMLPRYGELDLTPYFAPFYMLFFGLCLGDMGYGLVLSVAGLFVAFKMPKYKGYGKLIAWLGLGAIIMPALNGTFFGAKLQEILPMSESLKSLFFSDMKMFWFAIIFGLVQIVFARILNAIYMIRTRGIQAGLHNIGWAILISWCALAYASMQMEFDYPSFINYIGIAGSLLILLFTSDNKNIFVRVFKGVTAFYDITGVFGDMLSYIRLFGLGTAGGILGMVVNSVALQMSGIPYAGWFFTVLMLIVGHTAVLLLSALGAFVHPMRLTFVEFYKNAGFEGGGRAYKPLTKQKES